MKVRLDRLNDDYHFQAQGASDVKVHIDNSSAEVVQGVSPMELLLMGVGGCNAIDIVSILKKQRQRINSYRVEVEGFRKEERQAKPFEAMHVTVFLEGEIQPEKAIRAAQLSFEKYCSVSITMEACVKIDYDIVLNGNKL